MQIYLTLVVLIGSFRQIEPMPVETKVKYFKYFSTFFQICFDLSGLSLVFRRLVYYAMYYVRYRSGKLFDHLQIRNKFQLSE